MHFVSGHYTHKHAHTFLDHIVWSEYEMIAANISHITLVKYIWHKTEL